MQERVVLLLVVALVLGTTAAAVSVNLLRPADSAEWRAFDVSVSWSGTPNVGSPIQINVSVRQGAVDPKTLWLVYLSLDIGSLQVRSGTPATNPWHYPTVWNLTDLDLSSPHTFTVTAAVTEVGSITVYAMIWVPRADLRSVPIDATGHVNPAGVSLMAVESQSIWVPGPG